MKKKTKADIANKQQSISLQLSPRWMTWIEMIVFTLFAGVMLVGMNSDYLFTVQERSLFLNNSIFFDELTATPGGIIRWIGCFLTQFFYYPIVGASMLILIWLAIYLVTPKAFGLQRRWGFLALILTFALLSSVIDLGYWLYYHKFQGYWFAQSLSLLLTLAGLWWGRSMSSWKRYLYLGLWTALTYPILGWYALFGSLLIGLTYAFAVKTKSNPLYILAFTALLIAATPLLWYYHYEQLQLSDAWLYGFPLFQLDIMTSWITTMPFFVMTAACIGFVFVGKKRTDEVENEEKPLTLKWIAASIGALLIGGTATWIANFDDENFHAELRMTLYAEEADWKELLKEAAQHEEPTRQMVILKNIALIHSGDIGNQMFRYPNRGKLPHKRDGLKVHLAQTAAPLIYFWHGKWNYAIRWSIENGVETGFNVSELKLLARCALLNEEYETASKYIKLLEKTTFHKEEAERLEEMRRNPELITQANEYKQIRELHKHFNNDIDTDNGFCELYLIHHFSNTMNVDSKLLQEVTLNYALISKNIQLFWPRFFQYATLHSGEEMPIHYQEAAYMYGNLEKTFDISKMPFDRKRISSRYLHFQNQSQAYLRNGLTEKEVGEALKPRFGDTFWWFYYFSNDQSSY